MINALFIILQPVLPLCDYKVWIYIVRGLKAISYLYSMAQQNMMNEEFCACRMEERKHAAYFAMRREMDREEDKKK
jgi:hypothetical protein